MSSTATTLCRVDYAAAPGRSILLPVSGAGSDIAAGTLLMPGVSADTNVGVAIPITATSNADVVGILLGLHSNSKQGDATYASTVIDWFGQNGAVLVTGKTGFPSDAVEPLFNSAILRVDYGMAGNIAVASATASAITITSYAGTKDSGFLYVVGGTGIGQLAFVQDGDSGVANVSPAMATACDSTSTLTEVLNVFHSLVTWLVNTTTAPTLLDSAAADGTGTAVILENHIVRNANDQFLNPKQHGSLTGLNNLNQLTFYSRLALQDTAFTPGS